MVRKSTLKPVRPEDFGFDETGKPIDPTKIKNGKEKPARKFGQANPNRPEEEKDQVYSDKDDNDDLYE